MPEFSFLHDDAPDDGTIRINTSGGRKAARQPAPKQDLSKHWLVKLIGLGIWAVLIGGCWQWMSNLPKQTEAEFHAQDNSVIALSRAQSHIKQMLRAPRSAKWPSVLDGDNPYRGVRKMEDGTYVVHSYVDSQNGFGAMLRTWYVVRLRLTKDWDAEILSAEFVKN